MDKILSVSGGEILPTFSPPQLEGGNVRFSVTDWQKISSRPSLTISRSCSEDRELFLVVDLKFCTTPCYYYNQPDIIPSDIVQVLYSFIQVTFKTSPFIETNHSVVKTEYKQIKLYRTFIIPQQSNTNPEDWTALRHIYGILNISVCASVSNSPITLF